MTTRDIAHLQAQYDTPGQGFAMLNLKWGNPWMPTWADLAAVLARVIEQEEGVR